MNKRISITIAIANFEILITGTKAKECSSSLKTYAVYACCLELTYTLQVTQSSYNSISSPFSAARVTVYVYVQFPIRLHGICVSKIALAMCDAYVSTIVLETLMELYSIGNIE
ncbi:hypothetical protein T4E_4158 [Trichinella pseudospiralis]|uniref:Uncharacterized protein n=1 Tax=Trichinella pseudospiralis TaxID=6337 RepID=A0A0V0Y7S2_TRIPS|nr:hypothetical protein T4E_6953 [Trichinella pseudospiralis]KRX96532.1 hypothetical protein T4E_4158 [Trichinella pseudospiralis]